jgi:transposase
MPSCGSTIHAEVNGVINILKGGLPELDISWSSDCLAQPVVNRFASRKTRLKFSEAGT